jgi:aminopeptidase N
MREATTVLVEARGLRRAGLLIRSVELCFDLDPAKTIVASKLRIERNPNQAWQPLRLHGEELTTLRVLADGQSVSFRQEGCELVIDSPPEAASFLLEIRNTCCPEKNSALSGPVHQRRRVLHPVRSAGAFAASRTFSTGPT